MALLDSWRIDLDTLNWEQLSSRFKDIKFRRRRDDFLERTFSFMETNQFNSAFIQELKDKGAKIKFEYWIKEPSVGYANFEYRNSILRWHFPPHVKLSTRARGYVRDKVLFHELAHLWFGNIWNGENVCALNDLEVICEYIGRDNRTNPELLGEVLRAFNLRHYIYDIPSLDALSPPAFSEFRDYFIKKGYTILKD